MRLCNCVFADMEPFLALEKLDLAGFSNFFHGNVWTPGSLFQPKNCTSAVREIEMIPEPKRETHQDDNDRDKRERQKNARRSGQEHLSGAGPGSVGFS